MEFQFGVPAWSSSWKFVYNQIYYLYSLKVAAHVQIQYGVMMKQFMIQHSFIIVSGFVGLLTSYVGVFVIRFFVASIFSSGLYHFKVLPIKFFILKHV